MVVQELQTVALLNEVAVGIVSKGDCVICVKILANSAPSCIIAKGVSVIAR